MIRFSAKILKIGINPYVIPPTAVLKELFRQSGKEKGPIPVKVILVGISFPQTLVRYAGKWRLYLNTPIRQSLGKDVGDKISMEIGFDSTLRTIALHPKLRLAIEKNKKAKKVFDALAPSYQKEIIRYISHLKTEEAVEKNVAKAIHHLLGKERFIGREAVTTNKPQEQ